MFDDLINFLVPDAIGLATTLGLTVFSFFTGAMAATFGIGGGAVLIGAMAGTIPVNVVVAVHGFVQLGSNIGRSFLQRRHIIWPIFAKIAAGSVIGAVIGGIFFVALNERLLMLGLAVFILWMTWGPPVKLPYMEKWGLTATGVMAAFLSMFFGATGPVVGSTLRRMDLNRQQIIGTQAACIGFQHAIKVVVFVAMGVAIHEWLGLIFLMMVSGFAGTFVGTYLLDRIPENLFQRIFKIVLTLIALNLLRRAAMG